MRHPTPLLLTLLLLTPPTPARQAPSPTHTITVADYLSVATMVDPRPSPDGRWVVYVDSRWDRPSDRRNADLWIVAAEGGSPARRLTFDPASDRSPRWDPAGGWIYFLSGRGPGKGSQVWRIRPAGGAAFPVTRVPGGITGFRLAPGGAALYFVRHEKRGSDAWGGLRRKYAGKVRVHPGARRVSSLRRLDLSTWREGLVTAPGRYIRDFEISPRGRFFALHTCPDERLITKEGQSRIDIYDEEKDETITIPDGLYRAKASSPYGWIENMAWSPDGELLAFRVGWDGYPDRVYTSRIWLDRRLSTTREVARPGDGVNVAGDLAWRPGTRDLCFLGEWRALQHVYAVRDVTMLGQGEHKVLAAGNRQITAFRFLPGGDLVAIACAPDHGRDLFRVQGTHDFHRLTDINPQMASWRLPQISLVNWKGADGDRVEGVLELPHGHDREKDGPLPLIVELHGGPTSSTKIGMRFWCYGRTIMAARGYALFSPNYHGSTGYGDEFMTKLIGRENEIEVKDILTGVDHLVAQGIADPERLGVMGWSNGGFLTNAVITATDRFKAASSGAGVASQLLQWALEDTPGHVINYMTGLPWEKPEKYLRGSPIANLGRCRTPTLIHCGEEDPRVPIEHSLALFRGLRDYLQVPTLLLTYPGQGHGLGTGSMRQAKMEWDLAWFGKYVRGEGKE